MIRAWHINTHLHARIDYDDSVSLGYICVCTWTHQGKVQEKCFRKKRTKTLELRCENDPLFDGELKCECVYERLCVFEQCVRMCWERTNRNNEMAYGSLCSMAFGRDCFHLTDSIFNLNVTVVIGIKANDAADMAYEFLGSRTIIHLLLAWILVAK